MNQNGRPFPYPPPEGGAEGPQWHQPPGEPQCEPNVQTFVVSITGSETVGQTLLSRRAFSFRARSMRAFNTSAHTLVVGQQAAYIPPGAYEFWVRLEPGIDYAECKVYAAGATAGDLVLTFSEAEIPPTSLTPTLGSGGGGGAITSPLGQHTMAGSVAVVIASDQSTLPVSQASQPEPLGATNHAESSITIAGGVGSLAARATRTGLILSARLSNVADIVSGGAFHIRPGTARSSTARDSYSFTGTNGDILDVYEEYN